MLTPALIMRPAAPKDRQCESVRYRFFGLLMPRRANFRGKIMLALLLVYIVAGFAPRSRRDDPQSLNWRYCGNELNGQRYVKGT